MVMFNVSIAAIRFMINHTGFFFFERHTDNRCFIQAFLELALIDQNASNRATNKACKYEPNSRTGDTSLKRIVHAEGNDFGCSRDGCAVAAD